MNIVEFALKFKDLASAPLRQFGGSARQAFTIAGNYTNNLINQNQQLANSYNNVRVSAKNAQDAAKGFSLGDLVKGNLLAGGIQSAFGFAKNFVGSSEAIYTAQAASETRLAAVMKNTMGAAQEEVASIMQLASAQQKLGVISSSVQIAGAQELSTYLTKKKSLESILPVMNDMLAQQYGLNASQEQAQNIATMLGKVMDGQVGALSRYGYKFNEAQENILKYGTEAQRAATLIEVVSSAVGGVNEALAQTPEGILKQNQMAMEDLKGRVGKTVVDIQVAFAPLGKMVIDFVDRLLPIVENLIKPIANGVQQLIDWVKSLTSETGSFANHWTEIKDAFVNHIVPAAKTLFNFITDTVGKVVEFVWSSGILRDSFIFIGDNVKQLIEWVQSLTSETGGLSDYWNVISDVFMNSVVPNAKLLFNFIKDTVGKVVEFIRKSELLKDIFWLIGETAKAIGSLIGDIINALKYLFDTIVMPILNGIEAAYRWIKGSEQIAATQIISEKIEVIPVKTAEEKIEAQENTAIIKEIAKSSKETSAGVNNAEKSTTSGGPKIINITVQKFMDELNIITNTLSESEKEIQDKVGEVFARILLGGATS